MNRDELLKRLTELDFLAVDLALFLNINPNNETAIRRYNEAIEEADKVRGMYEENFGPLCSFRSHSKRPWAWKENPWPWQSEFNYDF